MSRRVLARDREVLAREARAGWPRRGGGARRVQARAALAKALWNAAGERKLPGQAELDRALEGVSPADLTWICELSPLAPLYLLPTRRFALAVARLIHGLGAQRVVEVAAGDGFLSRALRSVDRSLQIIATDSGSWRSPRARMSEREQRALRGTHVPGLALGADVLRMDARRAIRELQPDLVLASWLPPGDLLDALIQSPVQHVLEIGAGSGITASARSWRFAHEFIEGPCEDFARCRLDARPSQKLHSRITLYFGARHAEHFEETGDSFAWASRLG